MTDEAALLAAVAAHVDDDTPRLVYADWLDDHGEAERAEFIRSHVRLGRMDPWDDGYADLDIRSRQLERVHPEWLGWVAPYSERTTHFYGWAPGPFTRGFPSRLTLKPEEFVNVHDRLVAQNPAPDITFDVSGRTDTGFHTLAGVRRLRGAGFFYAREPAHAQEILRCLDCCPPLDHFGFAGCRLEEQDALRAFASPAVATAASLRISGTDLSPATTAALASADWPRLQRLSWYGIPHLDWVRTPWVAKLRSLRVADSHRLLDATQKRLLADTLPHTDVERLTLGWWALDQHGATALGRAVSRSRVRSLALHLTTTTAKTAVALLGPETVAGLRALFLSWADVSVKVVERLTGSGLRACGLDHITPPALAALASGPGLPELADLRLGLQWDGPDDPLPGRLCDALEEGAFPKLRCLTLCDTRQSRSGDESGVEGMGDRLAKALASCSATDRLGELVLDPPLTRAGAEALAASPHLDGLRLLKASIWPADGVAERALTDRFGRAVSLDVTSREY